MNHPPKIYLKPVEGIVYFGSRQFDDEIVLALEYFRHEIESLSTSDRIQRFAKAVSYWWRVGSPMAFSRGLPTTTQFLKSSLDLKELILVNEHGKTTAGNNHVDNDAGDHVEDFMESLYLDYSLLYLIKPAGLTVEILHDFALDVVLSTFKAQKILHNSPDGTDIFVLEYGTC